MMRKYLRDAKGVSMISLAIVIVVLVILTNVLIYNVKDNLGVEKLKCMQNDITNLSDKISTFYAQNGKIPASIKYTNVQHIKDAGLISDVADTGDFFVIELTALDNLTLNYGEDYKNINSSLSQEEINAYKDLYIINEASHNIFYVEGIKVDNEIFYTNYTSDTVDTVPVNLKYVDGVKIPDGFYYAGGTKDTGLVISDVPGDDLDNSKQGNQFVWIPVDRATFDTDFKRTEGYYNGSLESILSSCAEADGTGINSKVTETATTQKEAKEMYASVKENGGFYIGRYETGTTVTSESESGIRGETVCKKGAHVYNKIGWADTDDMTDDTGGAVELARNFAAENGYTSVTSTLCYGVQWDVALNFIDPDYITNEVDGKPNCAEDSYVRDSTGKGNHNEDANTNSWKGNLTETGKLPEYSIKNIYDMAGNATEWTMESYYQNFRERRGGAYSLAVNAYAASYRVHAFPRQMNDVNGFRITLYLKDTEKWSPTYDQETTYKDENGNTAVIPEGCKVSEKPGQNTIDEGLVIKDSKENEWVWIEVPKSIYTTATSSTDYANIEKDMQTYASAYRSSTYTDTWYSEAQHGLTETKYNELKQTMLKSVYENGGFYIGRYEVGTETARTSSSAELTTPIIQQNAYPYNNVTCKQSQVLANRLSTPGKTSSLMFGIQWDLVLKYIETKGGKTQDELKTDSKTWGNYYDAEFDITRGKYTTRPSIEGSWTDVTSSYTKSDITEVLLTTGATERNSTLNIYDLAGNIWEWTLEYTAYTAYPCSNRGGDYCINDGVNAPAFKRNFFSATDSDAYFGFRLALY